MRELLPRIIPSQLPSPRQLPSKTKLAGTRYSGVISLLLGAIAMSPATTMLLLARAPNHCTAIPGRPEYSDGHFPSSLHYGSIGTPRYMQQHLKALRVPATSAYNCRSMSALTAPKLYTHHYRGATTTPSSGKTSRFSSFVHPLCFPHGSHRWIVFSFATGRRSISVQYAD